jgi:hypothetical protein
MVMLPFLILIRRITFNITIMLFLCILTVFLISLLYQLVRSLINRFRSIAQRRMLDIIYGYMLGDLELREFSYRTHQRSILIEGFATVISSITGRKQERVRNAVHSLGLVSVLQQWLFTVLPSNRMRACYLLGLIQAKSSVQNLSSVLFDYNRKVATAAIIALGEIREAEALPSLFQFFTKCSFSHAWLVAAILPTFGSQIYGDVKPHLLSPLLSTEKTVLLLKVITNLKIGESFNDVKAMYVISKNLDIRVNALKAIGSINDLSAVKLVFEALSDPAWEIRAVACNIVGDMSLKGAAYRLIPLLKDESWFVRKNAAQALLHLGKIGKMTLVGYLEIDDAFARDIIVHTLEENGIVEEAIENAEAADPVQQKEGRQILRALARKGYTKYLGNFEQSSTFVRDLISETSNG